MLSQRRRCNLNEADYNIVKREITRPPFGKKHVTRFEDEGFLSPELEKIRAEIRRKHGEWIALIRKINTFGVRTGRSFQIRTDDVSSMLAAFFGFRILEDMQNAAILLSHGALIQAQSLIRNAFEALLQMLEYTSSEEQAEFFANTYEVERLRLLERAARGEYPGPPGWELERIKEEIEVYRRQLSEKGYGRPKDAATLAQKHGLVELYWVAFTHFSYGIHSRMHVVRRYFRMENGRWVFRCGPETNDLNGAFMLCAQLPLLMLKAVPPKVASVDSSSLERLWKRFLKLANIRSPDWTPKRGRSMGPGNHRSKRLSSD